LDFKRADMDDRIWDRFWWRAARARAVVELLVIALVLGVAEMALARIGP